MQKIKFETSFLLVLFKTLPKILYSKVKLQLLHIVFTNFHSTTVLKQNLKKKNSIKKRNDNPRTSLAVQRFGLSVSNAGSAGSIPAWGTKIPNATQQLSTCSN